MNENKYYVYQHVDTDGTVVYIGMGSGARVWRVEGRNPEHKKWMLERMPSKFKWVIVAEGLTQAEAFSLEHSLIYSGDWKFNLYGKSRRPPKPNFDHSKAVVNIDTGEIFGSVKEAADNYGVHSNSIIRSCKLGRACKGSQWGYYETA